MAQRTWLFFHTVDDISSITSPPSQTPDLLRFPIEIGEGETKVCARGGGGGGLSLEPPQGGGWGGAEKGARVRGGCCYDWQYVGRLRLCDRQPEVRLGGERSSVSPLKGKGGV